MYCRRCSKKNCSSIGRRLNIVPLRPRLGTERLGRDISGLFAVLVSLSLLLHSRRRQLLIDYCWHFLLFYSGTRHCLFLSIWRRTWSKATHSCLSVYWYLNPVYFLAWDTINTFLITLPVWSVSSCKLIWFVRVFVSFLRAMWTHIINLFVNSQKYSFYATVSSVVHCDVHVCTYNVDEYYGSHFIAGGLLFYVN